MGFTLQGAGPFLHWLTLGILFLMPVLAAIVLYKLGGLPGAIARSRGHPQAEAINICGWMGIITIVLWPIAMVWAYVEPTKSTSPLPSEDITSLTERIRRISQRLADIEGPHSENGRIGEASQTPKRVLAAPGPHATTGA
jgi:hypothetical protein